MIGEVLALCAALCWTISAVLYREALIDVKPILANTIRSIGTSMFIMTILALTGGFKVLISLPAHVIMLACVSGLVGLGFGDTLYLLSLEVIGVSRAVPITCSYPLFNIIFASLLEGEKVEWQIILAAVAIVAGIWLLSYNSNNSEMAMKRRDLVKGVSAAIATAILWSISISLVNIAVNEASNLQQIFAINSVRVVFLMSLLIIITVPTGKKINFINMDWKNIARLSAGGIIALGLGWFLLALSLIYIPETRAVPISSTTPLFSAIAGALFLHEKVTFNVIVGSAVIVLGVALIFMA
ncbi:MAG: DMT family transporter [Candidatus Bathyarchaeia archaeon]